MRIISGDYGGRRLESLPGMNTRPTGDKLKETMFNIIGPYFSGGKVLDLYAGSGALGIEAVSRGMDEAVLVDSSRTAIRVINENVKVTKEERKFEVVNSSSDAALNVFATRHEKFTLVFLDPPYEKQTVEQDIEQIIIQDMLDDVALIVCEVASDVILPEEIAGVSLWDERRFGKTRLYIYQKSSE